MSAQIHAEPSDLAIAEGRHSLRIDPVVDEIPARLLAMMLAAGGGGGARDIERLAELGAFASIGVGRGRFADIVAACAEDLGASLCNCSWLGDHEQACVDSLADHVCDAAQRLLLCRLAAAVLGHEDGVAQHRHLVLNHLLSRWHIDRAALAWPASGAA